MRLLCVHWQIASIHRDGPDLVFSYRNAEKARQLMAQSRGRAKVVDEKSIYLRLKPEEGDTPEEIYRPASCCPEPRPITGLVDPSRMAKSVRLLVIGRLITPLASSVRKKLRSRMTG